MERASARWRFVWLVPFNLVVLVVLVLRGGAMLGALLQLGSLVVSLGASLLLPRRSATEAPRLTPIVLVAGHYFVGLALTGGLASPLLPVGIPMFTIGPLVLEDRKRVGWLFLALAFGACVVGGLTFAGLTPLGPPLVNEGGHVTVAYAAIALGSLLLSLVSVSRIGLGVTDTYSRIALEVASRREEIFEETEDQTRSFEGVAARLAHEVKNPLAAIKGLSTHMARSAEDAKMKERLAIVASEAERLQEIVDGFLSFSRGLDDLHVAPTKPYDIARELSTLLETRANDQGVPIEVRGSRELTLDADGKKLRQALLNLVLNAMQASSKGSAVTVEVAKSCADGAAIVRVIDRGSGMTPDVLERIRKPYFTTKDGGSGLGIAIARGIIEQHGGTLDFESARGRGTSAIVRLPAHAMGKDKLPNPCRYAAAAMEKAAEKAVENKPATGDVISPAFARTSKVPS